MTTVRPPLLDRDAPAWDYRLAAALAYAINPLVLPPLLLGLVQAHFGAPAAEIGRTVATSLVFFALLPLGYVAYLVRRRRVAGIELRERRHRTAPFLAGAASTAAALVVLGLTTETARPLVVALTACLLANAVLIVLITARWKISLHAAALAGFVSMLVFVARTPWPALAGMPPETLFLHPLPLAGLIGLLPLLAWARVRTGAHSRAEVAAGAFFGIVVPYAELHLLLRAGLLAL